jgi:hypothetical protein
LKKFCQDEYELIVFNDAKVSDLEGEIQEVCEKYRVECVRYEPRWHLNHHLNYYLKYFVDFEHMEIEEIANQPSVRHSHVIQYALDKYGYGHDDIVVILDGDNFPIRPISIRKLFLNHEIVGIVKQLPEAGIEYLWVPFVGFDPTKLPSVEELRFHLDYVRNRLIDTGGHSFYYLNNYLFARCDKIRGVSSLEISSLDSDGLKGIGFNESEIWLIKSLKPPHRIEFHIHHHFLHYVTTYANYPGWEEKTRCITAFLNQILEK